MKPTAWFKHEVVPGQPRAVARWYWPNATLTEIRRPGDAEWSEAALFLVLNEEPDWVDCTEAEAEAIADAFLAGT
jgi:hypothetical protein